MLTKKGVVSPRVITIEGNAQKRKPALHPSQIQSAGTRDLSQMCPRPSSHWRLGSMPVRARGVASDRIVKHIALRCQSILRQQAFPRKPPPSDGACKDLGRRRRVA